MDVHPVPASKINAATEVNDIIFIAIPWSWILQSGGMVMSVSPKLLNDVALQAVREEREAGSEAKESEARDNRAPGTAAG